MERNEIKCSVTQAKESFHHSISAIFGKVGRIASEEVILHLVKTKIMSPNFTLQTRVLTFN